MEGNKKVKIFNPRIGKYKVSVTIGPNYATKRKEAAAGQLELMKIVGQPQASLISHVFARNQDWDGADEVSRILAATVPPELLQSEIGDDIPPQVSAFINGLKQQLQQACAAEPAAAAGGGREADRVRPDAARRISRTSRRRWRTWRLS